MREGWARGTLGGLPRLLSSFSSFLPLHLIFFSRPGDVFEINDETESCMSHPVYLSVPLLRHRFLRISYLLESCQSTVLTLLIKWRYWLEIFAKFRHVIVGSSEPTPRC